MATARCEHPDLDVGVVLLHIAFKLGIIDSGKVLCCSLVAEHLSMRLLIVKCGQFAFVCIYIYPSHCNCVGTVSVVSSPDY